MNFDKFVTMWNDDTISIVKIAKKFKLSVYRARYIAKRFKLRKKINPSKKQNIVGKTFGMWTVLEEIGKSSSNEYLWKCKCKCGTHRIKTTRGVKHNLSKSCGCLAKEKHKNNYYYELSKAFYNRIKYNASKRNIEFELSIEQCYGLYVKQGKKCNLTGLPISIKIDSKSANSRTASLDRIDSTKHYTIDNVQWVHKAINRLKSVYTNDELLFWARLICKHNRKIKINNDAYNTKAYKYYISNCKAPFAFIKAFGQMKTFQEWANDPICAVSERLIRERVKRGWTIENAISVPPRGEVKLKR